MPLALGLRKESWDHLLVFCVEIPLVIRKKPENVRVGRLHYVEIAHLLLHGAGSPASGRWSQSVVSLLSKAL